VSLTDFFTLSLSLILIENFVLARFLGVTPLLAASKKMHSAAGMCLSILVAMTLSSALGWCVNEFLLLPFSLEYMQTVALVLVIVTVVEVCGMLLKRFTPALYGSAADYQPLVIANCAVLGAAMLGAGGEHSLVYAVVYGAMAALGFLLAIVLLASIRERLEFSDCPACFEGFPIALVTAGLLAMAFMGFQGLKVF